MSEDTTSKWFRQHKIGIVAVLIVIAFGYILVGTNLFNNKYQNDLVQGYPIALSSIQNFYSSSSVITVLIDTTFISQNFQVPPPIPGVGFTNTTYIIGQYLHLIRTYQDGHTEQCNLTVTQSMVSLFPTSDLIPHTNIKAIGIPSNLWN